MTDRKLLELAAKAAGLKLSFYDGVHRNATGADPAMNICAFPVWNPLNDDGDALRLAVKLKIDTLHRREVWATTAGKGLQLSEAFDEDPCAATRLAITRAAAEIGRAMP